VVVKRRWWNLNEERKGNLNLGDPKALKSLKMCGHDNVSKGLRGLINLWSTMANDNLSREFRRLVEHVGYYWRSLKALPIEESLRNDF